MNHTNQKTRDTIKRTHTKEQDKFITEIKYKYLTASTKQEQDFWAEMIGRISFY